MAEEASAAAALGGGGRVVCIGDVHGNVEPLTKLWEQLEAEMGTAELAAATVVFLGDYCDRGPHTRQAFDFLIDLRDRRAPGTTVFLAGNHDLGMAAFLGCLPADTAQPDLDTTKKPDFKDGFWKGDVAGGMHYQGRRWGGSAIYDAYSTFESYGVPWEPKSPDHRDRFLQAVPEAHKEFLGALRLVHEESVPWQPGCVTCVHAGLVSEAPAEPQLAALRCRDLTATALFDRGDAGRIAALSARTSVQRMHPELQGKSLLVSGHHGFFSEVGDRIINDLSGGSVCKGRPLEALILPERKHVGAY